MGCFGYMCSSCNEQIVGDCFNGGERCVLIHKRHGEVIGQTVGKYNEYGGVIEDALFRSDEGSHPNTHDEICKSEMMFEDSHCHDGRVLVNGKSVRKDGLKDVFINQIKREYTMKKMKETGKLEMLDEDDLYDSWEEDGRDEQYSEFVKSLEAAPSLSGIVACHKVCFDKLTKAEQDNLPFSQSDPNQSWGDINPIHA